MLIKAARASLAFSCSRTRVGGLINLRRQHTFWRLDNVKCLLKRKGTPFSMQRLYLLNRTHSSSFNFDGSTCVVESSRLHLTSTTPHSPSLVAKKHNVLDLTKTYTTFHAKIKFLFICFSALGDFVVTTLYCDSFSLIHIGYFRACLK